MQSLGNIDLNEHQQSFAHRIMLGTAYAAWFETLQFQLHVTANFNRETTFDNGRMKLKLWSSRIERKLFGSRYYKKNSEDRMFFVAVPETSGASSNLHYHMLVRLPVEKHALFEAHAESIWRNFNPTGSLYVQKINNTVNDRRKVIGYDLKDTWTKDCLRNIIVSSEFANALCVTPNQLNR